METYESTLLLLLGFGGISIILALIYKYIRKNIYHERESVDRTFDAGGSISTSLTAVTVASQLLWPADMLQSATLTVKVGIAGPLWYTVGVAVSIALFPIASAHLKTRAPGAKTYPQIIFARHGKTAHLVYCFLALLVNAIIIAILIVAGKTTIQSVAPNTSDEMCLIILATIFGSYSYVGGLGTTFYVSYFNAVLLYATTITIVISVLYLPTESIQVIGSLEKIYTSVVNLTAPDGNEDNSFLTFNSMDGWIWALVGLFVTSALTFCDQASWQSRVAAKPLQGVVGFLIATFMWVAIPASVAATTGMSYLAYSALNTTDALTQKQIDEGLVTPFIARLALGNTGDFLVLTMIGMALMSTGSGEVMAVSSLIVYDIYQTHVIPFRKGHSSTLDCILCGKSKEGKERDTNTCTCPDVGSCEGCTERKSNHPYEINEMYLCPTHGTFRFYQDILLHYKSWCILWVSIGIIPYGMLVIASGIDLNWVYMAGAILTIPGLPGLVLTIFWCKSTSKGVIIGSVSGLISGLVAWFSTGSTYQNGLDDFVKNTSEPIAILVGGLTCFFTSLLITVVVSICTHSITSEEDGEHELHKLRNIDNPLMPWIDMYSEDISDLSKNQTPSTRQLDRIFKKAKVVSYIGGSVVVLLLVIIVPVTMSTLHVMSYAEFSTWTTTVHIFGLLMAFLVLFPTPIEETYLIMKQMSKNKKQKYSDLKTTNA